MAFSRALPRFSLLTLLLAAAIFYFWRLAGTPLVESDETTYARAVVEMMASSDPLTVRLDGQPKLDRAPLYFWLAMGSVTLLGESELAFRLPGVLAGVLIVALVWRVTYRLSNQAHTATLAGAITLFSPLLYTYAREVRLDSALVAALLGALLFAIAGWRQPRYLVLVLPALAVGFLFKSFAIGLALPVLALYSLCHRQWRWLRHPALWGGGVVALFFTLPWLIRQHLSYGVNFWQSFFFFDVWQRATEGFGNRSWHWYDYWVILWQRHQPWAVLTVLALGALLLFGAVSRREQVRWPRLLAPLTSALVIVLVFGAAKTHLESYLLPALPFAAMFLAEATGQLIARWRVATQRLAVVAVAILLAVGAALSVQAATRQVNPFHYDQREIGLLLRQSSSPRPLYLLNWPYHGALRYYGRTGLVSLELPSAGGKVLPAPAFLVVSATLSPASSADDWAQQPNLQERYHGKYLRLFEVTGDLTLPQALDASP